MTERESFHGRPMARQAYVTTLPISDEMLAEVREMQAAWRRWATATPEERAEWAEEQRQARARERAATERVPLTLDGLIDRLGFERAFAEHLMQPYCLCEVGADGWDYCQHAYEEGLRG